MTAASNPAPVRAQGLRRWLCLDSLVLAFGSWTVGFWGALAAGLGWAFALGFGVLVASVLIAIMGYRPAGLPVPATTSSDTASLATLVAIVVAWPVALDLGRVALAVVATGLLAVRIVVPFVRRRAGRPEACLAAAAAVALVAAGSFRLSWTAAVVVLCLVGVIAVAGATVAGLAPLDGGPAPEDEAGPAGRWERPVWSTLLLGVLGLLIGVWFVGVQFWNGDNAYYLNKAVHYSQHAASFRVQDYLFGVDDATHYPLGDVLSSFEPLLGTTSVITGASVPLLLFQLVQPMSMFLIPFAIRYAARGLGLRRPDLVGGVGGASILLMTGTPSVSLFAFASLGKTIGALVGIPLVIGAAGCLVRLKDRASVVRVALAAIGPVGLSPSLAPAVLLVLGPFTAVALWEQWLGRSRAEEAVRRSSAWLAAPLLLVMVFSLGAGLLQRSAGEVQTTTGFQSFASPEEAWTQAFATYFEPGQPFGLGQHDTSGHLLTLVFVLGATAVVPLLVGDRQVRRAVGAMYLLIFGIVFSPWAFDLIVGDLLDLNYFAWRLLWVIPVGVVIGGALALIDARHRLGILTVAAMTIGLGLSGPELASGVRAFRPATVDVRDAPAVWPWQAGIPDELSSTADAIVAVTPRGGRFLAPPRIEEVTTAIQTDVFPVYVRVAYVIPIGRAKSVPPDFGVEDRLLLASGMISGDPAVPVARYRQALERIDVATVCIDDHTADALREAVEAGYEPVGSTDTCELWARASG